ncbi:Ribosomal biogenesis protein LAS1L, partial [Stegodyphus mimosarum]
MFRNYKGVVAWYNPEQFRKVYHSLYSNDLTEKRWAVDQISVWETRCHPSLPTAVEATAAIIRAVIQDTLFESNATLCQENEIQMFYAMALVRFINLIFELRQNSFNKKRLSVIAKRLRMPEWIVELRNFATHSYLPSLPVLRKGAKAALDYLNRTFWRKEAKHVQSIVKTPNTEDIVEAIVRTIKEFQAKQYHRLYIEHSTKVR